MIDFDKETERLKNFIESNLSYGFPRSPDKNSEKLFEAMSYSLGAPGKRIRPVLMLLCCKAVFGDEETALPYACAVEYIHNYSLIHDDLPAMDDDDLRRGLPTNHKVYGEAMAILAGDGLLSAAFESMHRDYLRHSDDPAALSIRVRAGAALARGCGCLGMVGGQAADIEPANQKDPEERLLFIHRNKTAALIRASAEAGAILGGAGKEAVGALAVYGENLGLAFQIADDILDAGSEEKKLTYPSLYGLKASRERLEELSGNAVLAVTGLPGTDARYAELLADMARKLEKRTK